MKEKYDQHIKQHEEICERVLEILIILRKVDNSYYYSYSPSLKDVTLSRDNISIDTEYYNRGETEYYNVIIPPAYLDMSNDEIIEDATRLKQLRAEAEHKERLRLAKQRQEDQQNRERAEYERLKAKFSH